MYSSNHKLCTCLTFCMLSLALLLADGAYLPSSSDQGIQQYRNIEDDRTELFLTSLARNLAEILHQADYVPVYNDVTEELPPTPDKMFDVTQYQPINSIVTKKRKSPANSSFKRKQNFALAELIARLMGEHGVPLRYKLPIRLTTMRYGYGKRATW